MVCGDLSRLSAHAHGCKRVIQHIFTCNSPNRSPGAVYSCPIDMYWLCDAVAGIGCYLCKPAHAYRLSVYRELHLYTCTGSVIYLWTGMPIGGTTSPPVAGPDPTGTAVGLYLALQ